MQKMCNQVSNAIDIALPVGEGLLPIKVLFYGPISNTLQKQIVNIPLKPLCIF